MFNLYYIMLLIDNNPKNEHMGINIKYYDSFYWLPFKAFYPSHTNTQSKIYIEKDYRTFYPNKYSVFLTSKFIHVWRIKIFFSIHWLLFQSFDIKARIAGLMILNAINELPKKGFLLNHTSTYIRKTFANDFICWLFNVQTEKKKKNLWSFLYWETRINCYYIRVYYVHIIIG